MGNVVGPQNTWCDNYYCGAFCNHNSNAADNCEATMGNRQCCSEVFTNCAEVQLVGGGEPTPSTSPVTLAPSSAPPAAVAPTSQPAPEPEPEPEVESTPRPQPEPTPTPVPPRSSSCTGE